MSMLKICKLVVVTLFCVALSGIAPLAQPVWAAPDRGTYVVQSGDTLSSIGRRFGTNASTLQRLNRLPSTQIRAGQTLQVPDSGQAAAPVIAQPQSNQPAARSIAPAAGTSPATQTTAGSGVCRYTVKSGEGLTMIARRFGITAPELARMNGISLQSVLRVGVQLQTPCVGSTGGASPATVPSRVAPAKVVPVAPVTPGRGGAAAPTTVQPVAPVLPPTSPRVRLLPTATPEVRPRTYETRP